MHQASKLQLPLHDMLCAHQQSLSAMGMKMRILKSIGTVVFAAVLTFGFAVAQSVYAEEEAATSTDALQQLEQAAQDGQEAVAAPSEEEAKVEAGETFDTPHNSDGN